MSNFDVTKKHGVFISNKNVAIKAAFMSNWLQAMETFMVCIVFICIQNLLKEHNKYNITMIIIINYPNIR